MQPSPIRVTTDVAKQPGFLVIRRLQQANVELSGEQPGSAWRQSRLLDRVVGRLDG